jgi:hypothetical protein
MMEFLLLVSTWVKANAGWADWCSQGLCYHDELATVIKRTKQLQARKKELENEVKQHMQAIDGAKKLKTKLKRDREVLWKGD